MSQLPTSRFGFPGPRTVTTTSTRTTRIPGTDTTRTEARTNVTELTPCPARAPPQGSSGLQAPRQGSRLVPTGQPRAPSGITRPASGIARPPSVAGSVSTRTEAPTNVTELPPCPARAPPQGSSGLQAPRQGSRLAPPGQLSTPSGITRPASGIARPPSASAATPSGIARPPGASAATASGIARPPSGIARPGGAPPSGITRQPSGISRPPQIVIQGATPRQMPTDSVRGDLPIGEPQMQRLTVPTTTPYRPPIVPDASAPIHQRVQSGSSFKYQKPARPRGITPKPSGLKPVEAKVQQSLLDKSSVQPQGKVFARGKISTRVQPETMMTPVGEEQLLQRAELEQRVERTAEGERIIKNLAVTDYDEASGVGQRVELGLQQLDPQQRVPEGKEIVGVTSIVSVTASYTTVSKEAVRAVTEPLDHGVTMDPAQVAQLVEEEKRDVENTLKMIPPNLMLEPGKYEVKQRLQQLRLNSESIALLEESIVRPQVTADEAQTDPSPEAMSTVMHTVEKGISPQAAPDQVFNSLFADTVNEQYIKMSSVGPGPLQDVVVPTEDVPKDVHKEALSVDMDKLTERFSNITDPMQAPFDDIFTRVMDDMKKCPKKGKNKPRSFQPISDEKSLWVNAKLEHLVNVVGAEPADVLTAADLELLAKSDQLEKEMQQGVEFYMDTDALQYVNRIQLRGTQHPSYFPGYVVAVPDFPGIVQLARSPDEVFATAWKSVQPKYFDENSLHSMSF